MISLPRWTLAVAGLIIFAVFVRGQGSLTPPGAPAPTMKTLDQLLAESRTSLAGGSTAITISTDGSYYLTGNLVISTGTAPRINITANDVTLDLNGYGIYGVATDAGDAGMAISYTGNGSFVLRNGHIRGSTVFNHGAFSGAGLTDGVNVGVSAASVRIEGIEVYGVSGSGITIAAPDAVVSHCQTYVTGGNGIFASLTASSIDHCVQQTCGGDGITGGAINDCSGTSLSGKGINGAAVTNCTATTNLGSAITASAATNCSATAFQSGVAITATAATNCFGNSTGGLGMDVDGTATGCAGYSNVDKDGLFARTAMNCCGVSYQGKGLDCTVATGCYGYTTGGTGIYAYQAATGCNGFSISGVGLSATVANTCTGMSQTNTALTATSATNCSGNTRSMSPGFFDIDCGTGGVAIGSVTTNLGMRANIANSCIVSGQVGFITNKYNMP